MVNRLSLGVAMLVFALMPSDGLAASKAPPLRATGVPAPSELFSDGERLIGAADAGGMRVIDAATGLRRFVRSPPGCSPAGVGGGAVAFACPPPLRHRTGGSGAIVDLMTGAMQPVGPVADGAFGDGIAAVSGVGRRWVRLRIVGYHYAVDGFVERATGRLMPYKPDRDFVGDPDARSVWQPLCDPLALRWWQGGESGLGDEAPYAYRFPVGASIEQRNDEARQSIVVERCGRAAPLLVHRCSVGCDRR